MKDINKVKIGNLTKDDAYSFSLDSRQIASIVVGSLLLSFVIFFTGFFLGNKKLDLNAIECETKTKKNIAIFNIPRKTTIISNKKIDKKDKKDEKIVLKAKKDTLKDAKIVFKDKKDILKDEKTVLKDKKDILKDEKDILKDEKIVLKDKKDILKDKKDILKDKKDILKNEKIVLEDKKKLKDEKIVLEDKKDLKDNTLLNNQKVALKDTSNSNNQKDFNLPKITNMGSGDQDFKTSLKSSKAGKYVLQVKATTEIDDAENLKEQLKLSGYLAFIEKVNSNGTIYNRVRVGYFKTKDIALKFKNDFEKESGFKKTFITKATK